MKRLVVNVAAISLGACVGAYLAAKLGWLTVVALAVAWEVMALAVFHHIERPKEKP